MVILDTVGFVVVISDERSSLQRAVAGGAEETVSMKTLTHCFQDAICDALPTAGTHGQRTHVAFLALRCAITIIELHALQGALAAHTAETVGVEEFIHCPHCWLRSRQRLSTFTTHLCCWGGDHRRMFVHVLNKVLGHFLQFFHLSHS